MRENFFTKHMYAYNTIKKMCRKKMHMVILYNLYYIYFLLLYIFSHYNGVY